MQAITGTLRAILRHRFQGGADGFSARIFFPDAGADVFSPVLTVDIEKSLQNDASSFTIEIPPPPADLAPYVARDAFIRVEQWFGDVANAVQTFEGFIDKVEDTRDDSGRSIVLTGRDWMKHAIVQGFIVSSPQGADETGTVRTPDNGVFLNMEVSDIVTELLTHLAFPSTAVSQTSYQIDEFIVGDNDSYAATFSRLALLVGFRSYCDEAGCYRFEAPAVPLDGDGVPIPAAIFRAGGPTIAYPTAMDMLSIARAEDDYDLATRVKVIGPMTTMKPAWTQTWSTAKIPKPTGIAYIPTDTTHIKVCGGSTRRIYTLLRSNRTITATGTQIAGTYLAGLSTDPSDASILWGLDAPWRVGSGSASKILKLNSTTYAVLDSFTLPSGMWADIKADGSVLWLANQTTGQFHTRSKADGSSITSHAIGGRSDPTGVAVDGTKLYFFFAASNKALEYDSSDLSTLLRTISTAGTGIIGGEVDTTTHNDLFACSDTVGSGPGTVWEYTIIEPVDNTVSVVAISGVGVVHPEPTIPTGPLETSYPPDGVHRNPIRRSILQLPVITSYAQATDTVLDQLDQLDQARLTIDFGIVGHPGLQKTDVIQVIDAVTDISSYMSVDTYRASAGDGYFGTVAAVPVRI